MLWDGSALSLLAFHCCTPTCALAGRYVKTSQHLFLKLGREIRTPGQSRHDLSVHRNGLVNVCTVD